MFAGLLEIISDLSTKLPPITEASFGSFYDDSRVGRKEQIVPWLTEASLAFSRELPDCTGSTAPLISTTVSLGHERFKKISSIRCFYVLLSLLNTRVLLLLRLKEMEQQLTLAFLLYIYSCDF